MIRRPPRSTQSRSSAASDVYKRQGINAEYMGVKQKGRKMVYHYTNFVAETNVWWLRRIRPLWMTAVGLFLFANAYRYYFHGKIAAYWRKVIPEEEWVRRAELDKRNWGYNAIYRPTIARSRKRVIMELLGDQYRPAEDYSARATIETRTVQQIMDEENNWE
eukprot:TRINITY_DN497_c0_g1_i1.p1 TRINITY_DN497_c0_g1~~TRINITY_DN497_c0_g1_i1.p1  ORF type:complete len:162 (+),score=48.62 TRINITY_DN497_c0_g1_i1:28-513(+)